MKYLPIVAIFLASSAQAAPVYRTPAEALAASRRAGSIKEGVKVLDRACRGSGGRALRGHPILAKEADRLIAQAEPETRKRALDLHRCFDDAGFLDKYVLPRLYDPDTGVQAYAAEVSARLGLPAAVAPLLSRLKAKKAHCLDAEASADDVELCVWLTYAPGASLEGADRTTRGLAASAAAEMALESPHPKVREVAVETLYAAKLRAHASTIKKLVKMEKKGAFAQPNSKALLKRFSKRAKKLKRAKR